MPLPVQGSLKQIGAALEAGFLLCVIVADLANQLLLRSGDLRTSLLQIRELQRLRLKAHVIQCSP